MQVHVCRYMYKYRYMTDICWLGCATCVISVLEIGPNPNPNPNPKFPNPLPYNPNPTCVISVLEIGAILHVTFIRQ